MVEIHLLKVKLRGSSFYRLENAGILTGLQVKRVLERQSATNVFQQLVGFSKAFQTCVENCGEVELDILRRGAAASKTEVSVAYETLETGKAKPFRHYIPTKGRLFFKPGERKARIKVEIVDDDVYDSRTRTFEVVLSDVRLEGSDNEDLQVSLAKTSVTKVLILDDDHCGAFGFERSDMAIADDVNVAEIKVVRLVGAKGRVYVPYKVTSGTAVVGKDFSMPGGVRGTLKFNAGEFSQVIYVDIIDKDRYGEVKTFYIELGEPVLHEASYQNLVTPGFEAKKTMVRPQLGENRMVQIGICESAEMNEALNRLLRMTSLLEILLVKTWWDQISDTLDIPELRDPKCTRSVRVGAVIWRIVCFPWIIVAAILPPARLFQGWVAYFALLIVAAVLAALISDAATHLGCACNLKPCVTAIVLISIGMGLPDTFASHRAVIQEKTADSAIGHITGGNAVCVFLGMGMAWTVGATYQKIYFSRPLEVISGDIEFIVLLYCGLAIVGNLVLLLKRLPPIKGELGGPTWSKVISGVAFLLLWLAFVVLTSLKAYSIF